MTLISIQSLNGSQEYTDFYFNLTLFDMFKTEKNIVDIL